MNRVIKLSLDTGRSRLALRLLDVCLWECESCVHVQVCGPITFSEDLPQTVLTLLMNPFRRMLVAVTRCRLLGSGHAQVVSRRHTGVVSLSSAEADSSESGLLVC